MRSISHADQPVGSPTSEAADAPLMFVIVDEDDRVVEDAAAQGWVREQKLAAEFARDERVGHQPQDSLDCP